MKSNQKSERRKKLYNRIRIEVKHLNNSITHKKIMIFNIFISPLLSALHLRIEIWAYTHDYIFLMQQPIGSRTIFKS